MSSCSSTDEHHQIQPSGLAKRVDQATQATVTGGASGAGTGLATHFGKGAERTSRRGLTHRGLTNLQAVADDWIRAWQHSGFHFRCVVKFVEDNHSSQGRLRWGGRRRLILSLNTLFISRRVERVNFFFAESADRRVGPLTRCRLSMKLSKELSTVLADWPADVRLRGRLAQLVRAPARQAGGHRFESYIAHMM
jgi:hypothetical protein